MSCSLLRSTSKAGNFHRLQVRDLAPHAALGGNTSFEAALVALTQVRLLRFRNWLDEMCDHPLHAGEEMAAVPR